MKYLKQLMIILVISFIGEMLKTILPFPVPASIYGMVILFVCLVTGIIKLEQVRETGKFLIEIMPAMFIPAGVELMVSWGVLKPMLVPVAVITVVSLLTVLAVTGRVAQFTIRHSDRPSKKEGR
jgi:holin-like protein